MGQKNSAQPRNLESYTSFEVLPTEYFNRLSYQNMYQQQQQQPIVQPQQTYQPQWQQYPSMPVVQQMQQYYAPIAQAAQKVVEYTLPAPAYQLYGQSPMVHQSTAQDKSSLMGSGYYSSNQSSHNLGHRMKQQPQPQHQTSMGRFEDFGAIDTTYLNTASRKNFGLAPSSSQPIKSVPKFNRSFAY